ncbi:hypothetical protein P7C70_g5394, partial [Phenoliferia sp. Uapishka_3]
MYRRTAPHPSSSSSSFSRSIPSDPAFNPSSSSSSSSSTSDEEDANPEPSVSEDSTSDDDDDDDDDDNDNDRRYAPPPLTPEQGINVPLPLWLHMAECLEQTDDPCTYAAFVNNGHWPYMMDPQDVEAHLYPFDMGSLIPADNHTYKNRRIGIDLDSSFTSLTWGQADIMQSTAWRDADSSYFGSEFLKFKEGIEVHFMINPQPHNRIKSSHGSFDIRNPATGKLSRVNPTHITNMKIGDFGTRGEVYLCLPGHYFSLNPRDRSKAAQNMPEDIRKYWHSLVQRVTDDHVFGGHGQWPAAHDTISGVTLTSTRTTREHAVPLSAYQHNLLVQRIRELVDTIKATVEQDAERAAATLEAEEDARREAEDAAEDPQQEAEHALREEQDARPAIAQSSPRESLSDGESESLSDGESESSSDEDAAVEQALVGGRASSTARTSSPPLPAFPYQDPPEWTHTTGFAPTITPADMKHIHYFANHFMYVTTRGTKTMHRHSFAEISLSSESYPNTKGQTATLNWDHSHPSINALIQNASSHVIFGVDPSAPDHHLTGLVEDQEDAGPSLDIAVEFHLPQDVVCLLRRDSHAKLISNCTGIPVERVRSDWTNNCTRGYRVDHIATLGDVAGFRLDLKSKHVRPGPTFIQAYVTVKGDTYQPGGKDKSNPVIHVDSQQMLGFSDTNAASLEAHYQTLLKIFEQHSTDPGSVRIEFQQFAADSPKSMLVDWRPFLVESIVTLPAQVYWAFKETRTKGIRYLGLMLANDLNLESTRLQRSLTMSACAWTLGGLLNSGGRQGGTYESVKKHTLKCVDAWIAPDDEGIETPLTQELDFRHGMLLVNDITYHTALPPTTDAPPIPNDILCKFFGYGATPAQFKALQSKVIKSRRARLAKQQKELLDNIQRQRNGAGMGPKNKRGHATQAARKKKAEPTVPKAPKVRKRKAYVSKEEQERDKRALQQAARQLGDFGLEDDAPGFGFHDDPSAEDSDDYIVAEAPRHQPSNKVPLPSFQVELEEVPEIFAPPPANIDLPVDPDSVSGEHLRLQREQALATFLPNALCADDYTWSRELDTIWKYFKADFHHKAPMGYRHQTIYHDTDNITELFSDGVLTMSMFPNHSKQTASVGKQPQTWQRLGNTCFPGIYPDHMPVSRKSTVNTEDGKAPRVQGWPDMKYLDGWQALLQRLVYNKPLQEWMLNTVKDKFDELEVIPYVEKERPWNTKAVTQKGWM